MMTSEERVDGHPTGHRRHAQAHFYPGRGERDPAADRPDLPRDGREVRAGARGRRPRRGPGIVLGEGRRGLAVSGPCDVREAARGAVVLPAGTERLRDSPERARLRAEGPEPRPRRLLRVRERGARVPVLAAGGAGDRILAYARGGIPRPQADRPLKPGPKR